MAQITSLLCSKLFNSFAFYSGKQASPYKAHKILHRDPAPFCLHPPLILPLIHPVPLLQLQGLSDTPGTKPMPTSGPGAWLFLGLQRLLLRDLQNGISHFLPEILTQLSHLREPQPGYPLLFAPPVPLTSLYFFFLQHFSFNILHNLLTTQLFIRRSGLIYTQYYK